MSTHNHPTRDIKPQGQCPGCDEYHAAQPVKNIVKREVDVSVDVDPVSYVMEPANIDLEDGETIADFVARQKSNGDTAYDFARELDLYENSTISLQIIEHYDDGTSKCVDRGEWSDRD